MNNKYLNPITSELINVLNKRNLNKDEIDKYFKFNSTLPFAYSVGLIANMDRLKDISVHLDVYFALKEYDFFDVNNLDYKNDLSKKKYKSFWINLLNLESDEFINLKNSSYSKEEQEALFNLLLNDLEYEFKYSENHEYAIKERQKLIDNIKELKVKD